MRTLARKREFGEVWTPLPLVKEMLAKFSDQSWSDPTTTFLDHSCGHGNFLIGVVYMKLKHGPSTPLQALQTTYGVDIMEDNVLEARERILKFLEKATGENRSSEWVVAVRKNVIRGDGLKPETWGSTQNDTVVE